MIIYLLKWWLFLVARCCTYWEKIQVRCQGREGLQSFPFPIIIFYCLCCFIACGQEKSCTMNKTNVLGFIFKEESICLYLNGFFFSTLNRLLCLTTILNQILKETKVSYATCGKVKTYIENLGWSCRQLTGCLQSPAEPLINSSHTHKLNYAGLVNNCLRSI